MTSTLQPEQGIRVKLNKTYLYDPNLIDAQVGKSEEWATKTDGMVQKGGVNVDYSSKAYAIGGTGTETNNAKYYASVASAAASDSNVVAVGTDLQDANSKIKGVYNNKTNIDAVAGNKTNIDSVAGNETNINAVNANKTNIDAVVADLTNIDAVAADLTNIDSASTYANNANTWAEGSDADVAALGGTHSAKGWANQEANNYRVKATGSTTFRALKDRFADVINVKDFGAKGDGTNDDYTSIQLAINSGKSCLVFPSGVYKISGTLVLPDTIKAVCASGATIIRTTDRPIFYKGGSLNSSLLYPTAKISLGDDSISLSESDIATLNVDDWVFVRSGDLTPNITAGSRCACLRRVKGKSSSAIYVDASFYREMSLSAGDYALRLAKATIGGKVFFDGGTYTSIDTTGTTTLFDFLLCYAPDFVNVTIENSGGAGIRLAHCIGGTFNNSKISNLVDDRDNGHLGYGICLAGACRGFNLISGEIYKCRHGITTASVFTTFNGHQIAIDLPSSFSAIASGCGEPEGCYFGPAYVYGCTNSGLNTHEQGYNITITPNVEGCFDGVHVRNSDCLIDGGQIINCRRSGIRFSPASSNASSTVDINCSINGTSILNTSADGNGGTECYGIFNQATGTNIFVNNSKISGFTHGFFEDLICDNIKINNCEIDGVEAASSTQRGIYLKGSGHSVFNTTIKNCWRGIDTTAYSKENRFRHVSFSGCTTDIYPSGYTLTLNDHEVPRGYFISGRYYSAGNDGNLSTATFANGSCRASPIYIRDNVSISNIGIEITEAGSTGAVVRIGIYDDNGEGYPNSLVVDAGTVDATSTGAKELSLTSVSLTPGLYWLCACVQGNPSTPPKLKATTASSFSVGAKTLSNALGNTVGYGQTAASDLPSSFVSNQEICQNAPAVAIKIN